MLGFSHLYRFKTHFKGAAFTPSLSLSLSVSVFVCLCVCEEHSKHLPQLDREGAQSIIPSSKGTEQRSERNRAIP